MASIELTAPAKVNLRLEVLNKRKDNYHNILTLFERISLADTIRISKIPEGIIVESDRFITRDPKDNLVYKAAQAVLKRKKLKAGVKIYIKKRIPIAAGLGGGSSDAASVLEGINRLFGLRIKKDELTAIAAELGADVPFFVLNASFAIGEDRGGRLTKVNLKLRPWHLIIYPPFKVSSKDIYEAFDASRSCPMATGVFRTNFLTQAPGDAKIQIRLRSMDFNALESMLYNDLEDIVISKKRVIGIVIDRLACSLGKKAIVSGSGPSLFCLYRTKEEVARAKKSLSRSMPARGIKGWRMFIARTA